jgi:hypothetical protein
MSEPPITVRLTDLEERVAVLETLPARVDRLELQISQFRDEVRVDFAATRTAISTSDEETRRHARQLHDDAIATLRAEVAAGDEETRRHARQLHDDAIATLRAEISAGDEETRRHARQLHDDAIATLRAEISAGDGETRRYMRVLHEDVIARIALIGEGRPPRKKR